VHRIGRTGRAGANGVAVSLVSGEDRPLLADIERLIKRQIEQQVIAGFEPSAAYKTAKHIPDQRRPQRGQGQARPQGQGRRQDTRQGQGQGQGRDRGPRSGGEQRQDRPGSKRPESRWGKPFAGQPAGARPARRPDARSTPPRADETERMAQIQAAKRMQREDEPQGETKRTKSGPVSTLLGIFGRKAA
jgi:ATP-dependent RNA helicase RhlE